MGSLFPYLGLNWCPLQWKHRVLTTGLSGKSFFFFQGSLNLCVCVCVCVKVAQLCLTLCNPMDYTVHGILWARILEWDRTEVSHIAGRLFTSWIFPTQGSNPGLLHCRWILYQLSHKGSSSILEWVACPFSSGSSRPRNWTGVSCIAGRFFTNWAIRDAY